VRRNMHGGHLPNGHQGLLRVLGAITHCTCHVFRFNTEGNLLSGEIVELAGCLHKKPRYEDYDADELFAVMKARIGFVPGMIRVREFSAERVLPDCWTRLYLFAGTAREFIDSADSDRDWDIDWSEGRESLIEFVRTFLREGSFCMDHGSIDVWLGPDGTIHAT
jgi:hypothetical protein